MSVNRRAGLGNEQVTGFDLTRVELYGVNVNIGCACHLDRLDGL